MPEPKEYDISVTAEQTSFILNAIATYKVELPLGNIATFKVPDHIIDIVRKLNSIMEETTPVAAPFTAPEGTPVATPQPTEAPVTPDAPLEVTEAPVEPEAPATPEIAPETPVAEVPTN